MSPNMKLRSGLTLSAAIRPLPNGAHVRACRLCMMKLWLYFEAELQ